MLTDLYLLPPMFDIDKRHSVVVETLFEDTPQSFQGVDALKNLHTANVSHVARSWLPVDRVKSLRLQVPTCDSLHLWKLYSVALLADHAAGLMTHYPRQSHYPDTLLTSPRPILPTAPQEVSM